MTVQELVLVLVVGTYSSRPTIIGLVIKTIQGFLAYEHDVLLRVRDTLQVSRSRSRRVT